MLQYQNYVISLQMDERMENIVEKLKTEYNPEEKTLDQL